MKLEDIGFYTLSDSRAENLTYCSALQRCELILTSRCNFKCGYCRGMKDEDKGDISFENAKKIVDTWSNGNLKNIRFSGGEPTIWDGLCELVYYTKTKNIKRIALSTNGSADFNIYNDLYKNGVTDFSVSLDACCASTGDIMAGKIGFYNTVVENIKKLSKLTYVTVGVVLDNRNNGELNKIIEFSHSLGVSDIRIIPSAQTSKKLKNVFVENDIIENHPILKYRINNFSQSKNVRGLSGGDNKKCPLVLDDMAVLKNNHYPCIIYMREHGKQIGSMNGGISKIREERIKWYNTHNCYDDEICRNNCLDVCVDYNNRVLELNKNL